MAQMDESRYGLPVLRKYGFPATIFFQGVDYLMKPWLRDEMSMPGSVEWGNAPFSHSLIPLMRDGWREEFVRVTGNVPVTFCPEFYVPKGSQLPEETEYTLVLAGNSILYSACGVLFSRLQGDIVTDRYPEHEHAILFDGKIGILMREEWFAPFLQAFFLFQRYPVKGSHPQGRDCLHELIMEVERIRDMREDCVVVCPLDIEAPWIGSMFGDTVWEIFLAELSARGLMSVFSPLSNHLDQFKREAVKRSRPHRELRKWMNWEVQILHHQRTLLLQPRSDSDVLVRMIARGSDIFSAWSSKLLATKKAVSISALTTDDSHVEIPISYNQAVIDVQLAACQALEESVSFREAIRVFCLRNSPSPKDDYFIRCVIEMAERERL